jgi:hypothetical protein
MGQRIKRTGYPVTLRQEAFGILASWVFSPNIYSFLLSLNIHRYTDAQKPLLYGPNLYSPWLRTILQEVEHLPRV